MISALSPLDGRYLNKTSSLRSYFSEGALIKYRIKVEVEYFLALSEFLPQLSRIEDDKKKRIRKWMENLSEEDFAKVKEIEKVTNHDVKAVEYFIKDQFRAIGIVKELEFVHFGLTSQDINNTAFPMMLRDSLEEIIYKSLSDVVDKLKELAVEWKGIAMLARTHGQPASPTSLGKEMLVFVERVENQLEILKKTEIKVKFGGATGNLNAHKISYPDIDWITFANAFSLNHLGLKRLQKTTQIAHYDNMAAVFDAISRINTILLDLCRDFWTYISMDYFKQKTVASEVGSSAMPHKVNPIDFENAEGNLGLANAIFRHLSEKLPISRLQRDLTDSTVIRNIGVPLGHSLIAYQAIIKGLNKIFLNKSQLEIDLKNNWAVVSEAIQNILRREGYEKPYETLKALTRGNHVIDQNAIQNFIISLDIQENLKQEMLQITPENYIGYY